MNYKFNVFFAAGLFPRFSLVRRLLPGLHPLAQSRQFGPFALVVRPASGPGLDRRELLVRDNAETFEHVGVAHPLGMHPLVGQRQHDTLVDVLFEIDLILARQHPHHLAVVFMHLFGEFHHEPPLEINGHAAIFQTAVALHDDVARDRHVERHLAFRAVGGDRHFAAAVLDFRALVLLEQRSVHLETKFVAAVLQPFIRDRISLRFLHLYIFSAQSYEKIGHLQRKPRDLALPHALRRARRRMVLHPCVFSLSLRRIFYRTLL